MNFKHPNNKVVRINHHLSHFPPESSLNLKGHVTQIIRKIKM